MHVLEVVLLVVILSATAFFLSGLNMTNPAGREAQLKADKKAALELLCTQNNGVPGWWGDQFVCIQKKADK